MDFAMLQDITAMMRNSATKVERWFFIWDTLFPGEARPATTSKYTLRFSSYLGKCSKTWQASCGKDGITTYTTRIMSRKPMTMIRYSSIVKI